MLDSDGPGRGPAPDRVDDFRLPSSYPLTARCTPDGVYLQVSWFANKLLGIPKQDLEGRALVDFVHPDDVPLVQASFDQVAAGPTHVTVVYRHATGGEEWVWLETVLFAIRDPYSRAVVRLFCSSRDVSREMALRDDLRQAQQVLRMAIEHAPEGLGVTDVAGRFVMANPVLAELTGWSAEELLGRALGDLVHPDDRAAHEECIAAVLRGERASGDVDERLVTRLGSVVWVRLVVGATRDDAGRAHHLVVQVSDVQRFKDREHVLEEQAFVDPLTGVGNRRLLVDRLGRALADRRAPAGQVGVILADVDALKSVNDQFGHVAGDRILVAAARRIGGALRSEDTVARLGGDEFVVICPGLRDPEEAQAVLDRVREAVHPLYGDDRLGEISASVGMVLGDPGETIEAVLQRADRAMYEDKARHAQV